MAGVWKRPYRVRPGRSPATYYWKIDTEGNQFIDELHVELVQEPKPASFQLPRAV